MWRRGREKLHKSEREKKKIRDRGIAGWKERKKNKTYRKTLPEKPPRAPPWLMTDIVAESCSETIKDRPGQRWGETNELEEEEKRGKGDEVKFPEK